MSEKQERYSSNNADSKSPKEKRHIIGLNESLPYNTEKQNDEKLWVKLKLGHEDGFKDLFLKYHEILYRLGKIACSDSELIEDCIHELFIYLWTNRDSLAEVESVKYYLIVSFRRRLYKLLTKREKETKILAGIKLEYPKYENFFESKYITQQQNLERENKLKIAINSLSERQKELLQLRYVEGLSYQEISDKMGISKVSARKLSSKAINALRKKNL